MSDSCVGRRVEAHGPLWDVDGSGCEAHFAAKDLHHGDGCFPDGAVAQVGQAQALSRGRGSSACRALRRFTALVEACDDGT